MSSKKFLIKFTPLKENPDAFGTNSAIAVIAVITTTIIECYKATAATTITATTAAITVAKSSANPSIVTGTKTRTGIIEHLL